MIYRKNFVNSTDFICLLAFRSTMQEPDSVNTITRVKGLLVTGRRSGSLIYGNISLERFTVNLRLFYESIGGTGTRVVWGTIFI